MAAPGQLTQIHRAQALKLKTGCVDVARVEILGAWVPAQAQKSTQQYLAPQVRVS